MTNPTTTTPRKRRRTRSQIRRRQLVLWLQLLVLLVSTALPARAFLPPTTTATFSQSSSSSSSAYPSCSSSSSTTTTSPTNRHHHMLPWGETEATVVYQAESAASNLATSVLLNANPSNLLASLPLMYAAGLLTSCSPCVWGMLPLTVSYISNAAGERQDQQTTLPTLAFAAGLALVFCSLGVVAAQLGGVFGATSGPNGVWLALLSNTVCLAMGLKLLDLIDLPLLNLEALDITKKKNKRSLSANGSDDDAEPILLDATGRLVEKKSGSNHNAPSSSESGSLIRTFLLGGSSALVASPCATPVLTSILAFVASGHNPSLGALLLLGYTAGYSTPLLWIASTGGQALVELKKSKDGVWATHVAPWVTPITAGILLWYGTGGLLTALFGDPALAGLAPILE